MKTILIPVEQHSLIHNVLEAGVILANNFGSYIEGAAIGVDLPEVPVMDIAVGIPSVWDPEIRKELAEAARLTFENFFIAKGLPRADEAVEGVRWQWHPAGPATDSILGAEGRCFDISVVGRPSTKERQPRLATVESVLFDSGRPVLVVPPDPVTTIGRNIVICWNGSTETSRTVAFARPFLEKAENVTVLGIEGWGTSGPAATELRRMLRLGGISAQVRVLEKSSEEHGAVVLREATAMGCDLLIKGAYTQSRLRQMIFGGATNTILHETNLPVLIAH